MAHRAGHRAAAGLDDVGRILLERMAEGIVGGQEEPALAALLDDGVAGAVGERIGVVGVVDGIGVAVLVGQARAGGADVDQDALLLARHLADGDGDRRIERVGDHVDALLVEPFARLLGADVRLVLVIGTEHFDVLAQYFAAEIGHRHPGGFDRTLAAEVGIQARHVGQHADLDDIARDGAGFGAGFVSLRLYRSGRQQGRAQSGRDGGREKFAFHVCLL